MYRYCRYKSLSDVLCAAALVLFCSLIAACGNPGPAFRVPETPLLSGGQGWCVVVDAYARLKVDPDPAARDFAIVRRGDIFHILGSEMSSPSSSDPDGSRILWYRLGVAEGQGWIAASSIVMYRYKEQAMHAATRLP